MEDGTDDVLRQKIGWKSIKKYYINKQPWLQQKMLCGYILEEREFGYVQSKCGTI